MRASASAPLEEGERELVEPALPSAGPPRPGEESVFDTTVFSPEAAMESAAHRELAPAVLKQAVVRLRGLALGATAVFAAYLAAAAALQRADGFPERANVLGALGGALAMSLALLAVTRAPKLRAAHVVDLGYLYLFVVCFLLGVIRHAMPWPITEPIRQWSIVAMPILAFGALVPATPRKAAATLFGAALMDPLAFYVLRTSAPLPSAGDILLLLGTPFVGAAIACAVSSVIYQLGEKVEKARQIGSYRLVERLGVGGMAEVWRADHRMLARPAAVKLIRPQVLAGHGPGDAGRLVRLFAREARATASLASPHTIQVFDFGITPEGAFYFVMELLDGVDLQTLVERYGPQPPERVAHFLCQACHSLDEAHSRAFVHRDVKPANLFSCHVGNDFDFVKVLDFGLVLDRHPTPEEIADERRFVGTPAVMAPEMVRFQAPVDARADIYALGCVAYWLLTGKHVFEAATRHDMLVMHAHQKPVPPAKRVGHALHEPLERVVMRCLDKNPNKRPQTARELADELRALVFDHPWTQERAGLWWRSHAPTARQGGVAPEATSASEVAPAAAQNSSSSPAAMSP